MSGKKLHLKIALPATFVILITITGLVVLALNYFLSYSSLVEVATNYIDEVSEHTIEKTINHLKPAAQIAAINTAILDPNQGDQLSLENFNQVTFNEFTAFPQFRLLYYADLDGNFWLNRLNPSGTISTLIVTRLDDSGESREALDQALKLSGEKGETAAKIAELIAPYLQAVWYHRNEAGLIVSEEPDPTYVYDPRLRPWYKKAMEKRATSWTDPYIFASNGKPGVTVSAPIYSGHDIVGVVGVDIVLEEISDFLRQLRIGLNGRAFILDTAGRTIALPRHGDLTFRDKDGLLHFNQVENISDRAIAASFVEAHRLLDSCTYDPLVVKGDLSFGFDGPDQFYFGFYTPFPRESGLDWVVGIVAPEKDFLGKIRRNILIALTASLGILLLVIRISFYFTREVTHPLSNITRKARRIKDFVLDDQGQIESIFTEIDQLNSAFHNMQTGLRSFRKYVPADLVRYLISSGEEAVLGGATREVTIMFTDFRNFTGITELMKPHDLVVHLGRHVNGISRAIIENQGTVDKYIGDAVMAFWNAPRDVPDHPAKACRAALQWQKIQAELSIQSRKKNLPELTARIGINTGEVIVGNMGAEERMNYTVIGDAVNLASRLETLGKLYGVDLIVGQTTMSLAEPEFEFRLLDKVAVKGKTQSIFIYELLGEKDRIDDQTRELTKAYEIALEAYFAREWRIAARLFKQAVKILPRDQAAHLFVRRSLHYQTTPPPEDWDGTFVMTQK